MQGQVSVEEALEKGNKMIKYPMLAISAASVGLGPLLSFYGYMPMYWSIFIFFAGFSIGLLYSSYMTTKWRVWAFTNVTNVHELKKIALREKYLPGEGSWLEKIEIKSPADKAALSKIQERFNEPYSFPTEIIIPVETQIFFSKKGRILSLIIALFCMACLIYLLVSSGDVALMVVMGIVIAINIWKYRKLSNRTPQIILNDKGIQTVSSGFKSWSEITDEEIVYETLNGTQDETERYYLRYMYPGSCGYARISIKDMDISPRELDNLLAVYRDRAQKKSY